MMRQRTPSWLQRSPQRRLSSYMEQNAFPYALSPPSVRQVPKRQVEEIAGPEPNDTTKRPAKPEPPTIGIGEQSGSVPDLPTPAPCRSHREFVANPSRTISVAPTPSRRCGTPRFPT